MAEHEQPDGWRQWVRNNMAEPATAFTPAPADAQPFSAGIHLQPPFDLLDALPPLAGERLRLLRQRAADAHLLIPPGEDVRQANLAKTDAANALKTLVAHPQDFGRGLSETDPLAVAAKKHLDKMTDDARRLKELQAAWQTASQAKAAVETWLRDGRPHGTVLEDYETEVPKLAKGENGLLDAVENRRRRGREIRALIHTIRSSCFPKSYCKQRARKQVDMLAERGAVSVSRLVELDVDIEFPSQLLRAMVHSAAPGAVVHHETVDVVGLIAWLHGDALIKRIDGEIDSEGDDENSLTHEQRQQREAEAQADLLFCEREEAALTWSAIEQGLPVEFRPDISPLALLSVRLVTAAASPSPETTPGYSWPWRR